MFLHKGMPLGNFFHVYALPLLTKAPLLKVVEMFLANYAEFCQHTKDFQLRLASPVKSYLFLSGFNSMKAQVAIPRICNLKPDIDFWRPYCSILYWATL